MGKYNKLHNSLVLNRLAKYRICHAETGHYLHMSGDGFTQDRDYSWRGTVNQLRTMVQTLEAKNIPIRKVVSRSVRRWDDVDGIL